MPSQALKQLSLKPQDLLVTLKVAINPARSLLLSDLSNELGLALSIVHRCVGRAEQARLLTRSTGALRTSPASVKEFVIHGARYAFPGQLGTLTQGIPTAIGGPVLAELFEVAATMPPVWPDPSGSTWGPSLQPLHPCVPFAARTDKALHVVLSLLDALRVGAAREREIAVLKLEELL